MNATFLPAWIYTPPIPRQANRAKSFEIAMNLSPAHPVLRGDRDYLRALRAAEMKAWELTGGDSLNLADS
jgi:hypothetical protein